MGVAFITGSEGFVGSAVARALAGAGYKVRALVRRSSPRINLDIAGLEVIEGDTHVVEQAPAGARYIFHVAADYRLRAPDRVRLCATTRREPGAVLTAAMAAGDERIVYTSSVGADAGDRRYRPQSRVCRRCSARASASTNAQAHRRAVFATQDVGP